MEWSTNKTAEARYTTINWQSGAMITKFTDGSRVDHEIGEKDVVWQSAYLAPLVDLVEEAVEKLKADDVFSELSPFDKTAFAEELIAKIPVKAEVEEEVKEPSK